MAQVKNDKPTKVVASRPVLKVYVSKNGGPFIAIHATTDDEKTY